MLKKMLKKRKGFTLTELIVVVTILGVLTAIAVPLLTSYIGDSEKSADNSNAKVIEGVVKRAAAKRTLTLNASLTGSAVVTVVESELGSVPNCQQADFEFYVKQVTGEVQASEAAPEATGWVAVE
ncbi:MAG: prepilin-type N-terminal cleavage/methylation domain-containing protein [Clostridiales bacterium]